MNTEFDRRHLADLQAGEDRREVALPAVGIKGFKMPVRYLDSTGRTHHSVASITLLVNLLPGQRGIHMSRLVEAVHDFEPVISAASLRDLLRAVAQKSGCSRAEVTVKYPYFIEKHAPVSGRHGLLECEVTLTGDWIEGTTDILYGVVVPVTTVCPCSKAVSRAGAHNQRGYVTVQARFGRASDPTTPGAVEAARLERLVATAEASASQPLYSVLKREDEKFVTEEAYDHPVFVEDVVRNVVVRLREIVELTWYRVEVENLESIHAHNAYAMAQSPDNR